MKKEWQNISETLSKELIEKSIDILFDHFNNKRIDISHVLNIILSSHFNSMFSILDSVSEENQEMREHTKKIIESFVSLLNEHEYLCSAGINTVN